MSVKVVLKQDIQTLGREGDIVYVKDGYARNYLLRFNKAVLGTPQAVKEAKKIQEQRQKKQQEEIKKAKALVKDLSGVVLEIKAKQKKGKLFGSVKDTDIAKLLKEKGYQVTKDQIEISEPIKEIGSYQIKINPIKDVATNIKLEVKDEEK
ncbi:MAG: 50S ribosomal protein L9 [Candidatus Moranbacteria bacterium]|nr:50S ribosomal protein L9 [Candidatus Moranbacteria bacterium]